LSGVGKPLLPTEELWYKRTVDIPSDWKSKRILLHFGAVDYKTSVYINNKLVGEHTGSSDPFSFDITPYLTSSAKQEIKVKVWDPTDSDIQPRGKQALNPFGFWYTAVSGIWQTVWLEPVSKTSIKVLNPVADIDKQLITLNSELTNQDGTERIKVKISFKGKTIEDQELKYKEILAFKISNPNLWSPDAPHIYNLDIQVKRGSEIIDSFSSYFAMREITLGKDENGFTKLLLNNKPLFQWGVLDQGWWPESLLTPPTDAALKYDMQVLKDLGFNMIRKHIKVEPARFYYHADTMGLLVWQDMPSGFLKIQHPEQHVKFDAKEDWKRPEDSAKDFEAEWKSIMDNLRFFPSIVVWVPFNEGWGQYDSERIAAWTQNYDKERLVNATSGWTDRNVGAMYDAHQYPGPAMEPGVQNPGRAIVLGEFGGLGWPIKGHLWDESKRNWGYRTYLSKEEYTHEYSKVIKNVYPLISRGLAAAIYTQTSDVEAEANGLLTYDRRVLKVPESEVMALHQQLYKKYSAARFLISDSEIAPSKLNLSKVYPGEGWNMHNPFNASFKELLGPAKLKQGDNIWAVNSFIVSDISKKLGMKIYAQGDLKIYLNGNIVYDKKILTKRHYDELNLSDFGKYLKSGKNIIALELKNAADSDFDFGLYEFD
ncbi:MAG: glycoside hydrolase family 2 protein, partial [Sphingobacteriaceae bacterium]